MKGNTDNVCAACGRVRNPPIASSLNIEWYFDTGHSLKYMEGILLCVDCKNSLSFEEKKILFFERNKADV